MQSTKAKEVLLYSDSNGKEPFVEWLNSLDITIRARVRSRLVRLQLGNMGDCKALQEGVSELRLHFGAGYRVYFGQEGKKIIVLLSGGDKKSQKRDIAKAVKYFQDYKDRKNG